MYLMYTISFNIPKFRIAHFPICKTCLKLKQDEFDFPVVIH